MAKTTEQREQTPEERKNWIKRTYWDYLCAYRLYQSELEKDYDVFMETSISKDLLEYEPRFDDFELIQNPQPSSDKTDKQFGHIESPAPDKWSKFMYDIGFRTTLFTPITGGHDNDFAVYLPDDKPINGKKIFLDPTFACRYIGKIPITTYNLDVILPELKSIILFHRFFPQGISKQKEKDALRYCYYTALYEDAIHTMTQYTDFTLCPLVDRIKRYYTRVLGNNIFSKDTDLQNLTQKEMNLREIYLLRDVYIAHNNHYPPTANMPNPRRFSYTIYGDGFIEPKVSNSLDREKIFKTMTQTVIEVLNHDVPEESKFHNQKELEADLARHFPDLSQKKNGVERAVTRLVRYISHGVNFEGITKNGFGIKKGEDVPLLLDELHTENPQTLSVAKGLRDIALHDHFPFEEFYGEKMATRSNISPKNSNPRLWEKVERVRKATMALIKTAGDPHGKNWPQQVRTRKQEIAEQKKQKEMLAARQRRRRGGR